MIKNNFNEIESFEDFEAEKMRLYYELKLTEKKLLIKRMEIAEALSPANLLTSIFAELLKPLFKQFGKLITNMFKKDKPETDNEATTEK